MTLEVELFSATDPPYLPSRQVWYFTEFCGIRSERSTDYATVLARAESLCAEHSAYLIDRSDKDSGLLRSMLG